MSFKAKLDIFEGPLDLLVYLIQKNEIDIHDIPITLITEQYLEYLNLMQALNLDLAGEYLVMASTLMRIKSKMLLPEDPAPEPAKLEEDPREELVRQLIEYMRYKDAASNLKTMETERSLQFGRYPEEIEIDAGDSPFLAISIFDLITAFSKVLAGMPREVFHQVIKDEFTVAEKVHTLLHLLVERPSLRFGELFSGAKNRLEAVTTFLALLELVRLKEVLFTQGEVFGEIEIMRNPEHHAVRTAHPEKFGYASDGPSPSGAAPTGEAPWNPGG